MYLIEGLAAPRRPGRGRCRVAILTKTHQAMVGLDLRAIDIGQVGRRLARPLRPRTSCGCYGPNRATASWS
ncbi:hypothetical protein HBB16_07335 [Pseudonocardia sp. MCCB 268]|nr:hypothetical protein [Pseudonocardia cytotoxica]